MSRGTRCPCVPGRFPDASSRDLYTKHQNNAYVALAEWASHEKRAKRICLPRDNSAVLLRDLLATIALFDGHDVILDVDIFGASSYSAE